MGSAVDNRIQFVENDTSDVLDVEYEDLDLTGYSVALHIGYPACPLAKAGTLTDALSGKFRFSFNFGDLHRGSFPAEIRLTDPMGKEQTITSLTFDILRRVKG